MEQTRISLGKGKGPELRIPESGRYLVSSYNVRYQCDAFGIHQLNPQPFTYDHSYIHTYNTEAYKRGSDILQALRLGFVIGAHGEVPTSIQDHGYGNGDFMLTAKSIVHKVMGCDVTGVLIPGCEVSDKRMYADVWTFWDCLEHQQDLSFLRQALAQTICISLPWCHELPGTEWFDNDYKHRKPDEHLHHFNPLTLATLFGHYGWKCIAQSNHEDIIRVSTHGRENILSMAFVRK